MRIEQVIVRWIRCSVSCTLHPDSFTDPKQTHCFLQCEHFWVSDGISILCLSLQGSLLCFQGARSARRPRPSTLVTRPPRVAPEERFCSAGPAGKEKVRSLWWVGQRDQTEADLIRGPQSSTESVCRSLMLKTVCSIWAEPIRQETGHLFRQDDGLAALITVSWCRGDVFITDVSLSVLQSCVSLQAESFSPVYQRR